MFYSNAQKELLPLYRTAMSFFCTAGRGTEHFAQREIRRVFKDQAEVDIHLLKDLKHVFNMSSVTITWQDLYPF